MLVVDFFLSLRSLLLLCRRWTLLCFSVMSCYVDAEGMRKLFEIRSRNMKLAVQFQGLRYGSVRPSTFCSRHGFVLYVREVGSFFSSSFLRREPEG